MKNVVIASAVRTAGGKFGGSLSKVTAPELGAAVIKEALIRSQISPDMVDQVIFGNAWQAGVGANPARIAAVKSGIPVKAPAFTVNIRCGSSLRATCGPERRSGRNGYSGGWRYRICKQCTLHSFRSQMGIQNGAKGSRGCAS